MLKITEDVIIHDTDVIEAIARICSPCFHALAIANAFAGRKDTAWKLITAAKYSLTTLLIEAHDRKINLDTVECAVEGGPITNTARYKKAIQDVPCV